MAFKKVVVFALGTVLPWANALTIEGMLGAPRRSTANVNPSGKWALFTATSYDWDAQKSSTTWNLLDVASGKVKLAPFGSDVSEVVWIGDTDTSILYINGTNDNVAGGVTLYTADIGAKTFSPTLVASLEAPFQGLKAVQTKSGDINFVVNTLANWNDGSAYNPELATASLSSGAIFDANYIRHWDVYITPERYAVFSGKLALGKECATRGKKCHSLKGGVKNLLLGINATVTRPETPVQPFGDQGDYDLSPDGQTVAFLTKAPELSKANHTASYIYLVPHDGSKAPVSVNGPGTSAPANAKGASGAPHWSPDGKKLAYIQQDGVAYESDRYKLYVATVSGLNAKVSAVAEDWDSSPSSLQWTPNGKDLWVASELHASTRLFVVPYNAKSSFVPKNFTGPDTNLADFTILPNGRALVSAAASWTSRVFYTQAPGKDKKILFTANEVDPELKGLKPDSVSNFWVENDDGDKIQTFVFYPTDFDPNKKYPLAFIIHGGPQSSQGDSWSTRWNLRLWAEQGFVVTTVQFTGTPSYGQAFTDKIQNNWGGTPYTDLVTVFEHLKHNVPYVDTDRAVAAGASFGCYMTNWIQGHALGREFKALVCHDGKVNQVAAYATDELWFIQHDSNGTIWDDRENYELWDPLMHARDFATPEFIIHSDGDYRVSVTEGIQTFNILQSLGVPSRFLHFPDETHWISNRHNSVLWHSSIFNWIRYWVGLDEELIQDGVVHM
ncbi:putative dipeptidyl aminopeptidase [Rosellinia necatrix]|uniref:Dipeptidyl-peptidase V n=1 Tax=Rosellinia necatrix TaxID=77044 RepID=A0A1W2TWG7_ROSNE|nr:putative dipeptidyl aminopeptidase [Rosellinia necatrix]